MIGTRSEDVAATGVAWRGKGRAGRRQIGGSGAAMVMPPCALPVKFESATLATLKIRPLDFQRHGQFRRLVTTFAVVGILVLI